MYRDVCLAACAVLCGCVGISLDHHVAEGIQEAKRVVVAENPKTSRQSFRKAVTMWLKEHGYEVAAVQESVNAGWRLDYEAFWSWDLAYYLSDAKITALLNGEEKGSAKYSVFAGPFSVNPSKWKHDETTVDRMMRKLFGMPDAETTETIGTRRSP